MVLVQFMHVQYYFLNEDVCGTRTNLASNGRRIKHWVQSEISLEAHKDFRIHV